MNTKIYNMILAGVAILLLSQSCAPVFSELQGARMVGKNKTEVLPYYSSASVSDEGETDGVQNQMGLQVACGVTPKLDIRARFEHIWGKGGSFGDGIIIAGVGPKISLIEKNMALYLPIGRAFGDGSRNSWEIQPTLLFTLPVVQNKLDINFSPKYLLTFCEDCEDFVAFNFGLSISNNLSQWSFRSEYGQLYNIGESGHVGQFSIGIATLLSK